MKKGIFLSILLHLLMISVFGQTQISYESNAFLNGDQHHYLRVTNIEDVSEGVSGFNITWDYSHLIAGDSVTSYLLDATQQPGYEHFPEANVVIKEDGEVIFFHVSPQGIEKHGYLRIDNYFKYDLPIKRFSFPFSYGEKIEGKYALHRIGSSDTNFHGTYNSEIDGIGTLILPDNITIQNVLRVRSSQKYDGVDSGYATYRWYSIHADPVLRYPLLSIIKREGATDSYIKKVAYYAHAGQLLEKASTLLEHFTMQEFISPEGSVLKIKAYPNPFIEKVTVDYNLPDKAKVTILVSDALGRFVETLVDEEQTAGQYSVDFKGKGYYFLYYITTLINDRVVSSKKIYHVNR